MLHKKSVKKSVKFALKTASSLCTTGLLIAGVSYASADLPQGGSVSSGTAHIQYKGDVLHIDQASDKAVIDWHSFSVGKDNTVNFHQPSTDSATLNRVTGDVTTQIAGQINAKGSVFLINPNGIMITKDGVIDTGNFVASTLDIDNNDFLNGDFTFTKNGKNGVVDNRGSIQVQDGGFVALLGGAVKNDGIVHAHVGKVGFAGGEKIIMAFGDNDFLRVEVPTDMWNTLQDANGNKLSATIDLNGDTQAHGGFIDITVADASDILRQTISINGVIAANTVSEQNGIIAIGGGALNIGGKATITADAGTGDAGTIDITAHSVDSTGKVSATATQGKGGTIAVSLQQGANFNDGATFDVSATQGGGDISFVTGTKQASSLLGSVDFIANSTQGKGGYIDITSKSGHIGLLSGKVSASGKTQGGRVRIGGAFQGGGFDTDKSGLHQNIKDLFVNRWADNGHLYASKTTKLGNGVHIDISSTHGTGGTAIIWSDHTTDQLGSIIATGNGKGGAVEISGKQNLYTYGLHKVSIGNGELLLDPKNIILNNVNGVGLVKRIFGGDKDGGVVRRNFGKAIAVSNDGTKIAIGAPGDLVSSPDTKAGGSVYLFLMDYTTGAVTQKLRITNGTESTDDDADGDTFKFNIVTRQSFGESVALSSDGKYLAIGDDTTEKVWVLETENWSSGKATTFKEEHVLLAKGETGLNIDSDVAFGTSLAISDDGTKLAVGAPNDHGGGGTNFKGAVYLFNINTTNKTVTQRTKIRDKVGGLDLQNSDNFGFGLSMNADGTRLAVGAIGTKRGSDDDVGSVFIMDLKNWTTGTFSATQKLELQGEKQKDYFGSSVALNGDGTKLVVGAPGVETKNDDDGFLNFGAIYTYDLTWTGNPATVTASNKQKITHGTTYGGRTLDFSEGGAFGHAVAMSADATKVFVGQSGIQVNSAFDKQQGSVYVFNTLNQAINYKNMLNAGTNITLLASNDITINAVLDTSTDTGTSGKLQLFAGRSIIINQDVKIKGGLTLVANMEDSFYALSPSVSEWVRKDDTDAEITVADGKTISGGDADLLLIMGKGHSKEAKHYAGNITLGDADANRISIVNKGKKSKSGQEGRIIIRNGGQLHATKSDAIAGQVTLELRAQGGLKNESDANALKVEGNGRYLVWAKYARFNDLNGITNYDFSQFDKKYDPSKDAFKNKNTSATSGTIFTGNGFVYEQEVRYNLVLSGNKNKVYDGTANVLDMDKRKVSVELIDYDNTGVYFGTSYNGNTQIPNHRNIKMTIDDSKMTAKYTATNKQEKSGVRTASYIVAKGIETSNLIDKNTKPVYGAVSLNTDANGKGEAVSVGKITQRTVYIDTNELVVSARKYDGTKGAVVTVSTDSKKDGLSALSGNTGVLAIDQGANGAKDDAKLKLVLTNGAFVHANKNAGADKQLQIATAGNIVLHGSSKDNYDLKVKDETGAVKTIAQNIKVKDLKQTINKRALILDASELSLDPRVYDGTAKATVKIATNKDGFVALDTSKDTGKINGDTVTLTVDNSGAVGAFKFANANAGANKQVSIDQKSKITLSGASKDNYVLHFIDAADDTSKVLADSGAVKGLTKTIDKASLILRVSDLQVKTRVYDRTTNAPVGLKANSLGYQPQLASGDKAEDVTMIIASGAFAYADNKVGDDKIAYLNDKSKISLGGLKGDNYKVVIAANNGDDLGLTGDITKRKLTLDASELNIAPKVYNGKVDVTFNLRGKDGLKDDAVFMADKSDGDVSFNIGTGGFVFNNEKVGKNKQIKIGDKTKFTLSGADAGNYEITLTDHMDVKGLKGTIMLSSSDGDGGSSGDSGGGGGGGGAIVLVGVGVAAVVMGGGATAAAGAGAVGTGAAGGASGGLSKPLGSVDSIFNQVFYAHIKGIDMRAITHAHPKTATIFTQNTKPMVPYNTKIWAKYDLTLLANNIKAQQVIPLWQWTPDMYESIKQIFVQQTPNTTHKKV